MATSDFCADVLENLNDHGLRWGVDFITYRELPGEFLDYFSLRQSFTENKAVSIISSLKQGKKLAVLYGNCQIDGLRKYLLHCPPFAAEYEVLYLPPVFAYTPAKIVRLYESFWPLCDLFIGQIVTKDNRFAPELATENLLELLPRTGRRLLIPNAFFRGYFPQARKNHRNVDMNLHQSGRFPFADHYVDAFAEEHRPIDYITAEIMRSDFLKMDFIMDACETSLAELAQRETCCDIAISDYIRANYRERQLFYSENHPINALLVEMSKRILRALGLREVFVNVEDIEAEFTLKGQDSPVYPSVIETLGLKLYDTQFFPNRYLWSFYGNLIEFTEEYLKWCWGVKK